MKTRLCSQHPTSPVHRLSCRLQGKGRKHKRVSRTYISKSDLQEICNRSHIAIRRAKAGDAKTIAQICSKVVDVAIGMYKMWQLCSGSVSQRRMLEIYRFKLMSRRHLKSAHCRSCSRKQGLQPSLELSLPPLSRPMLSGRSLQLSKGKNRYACIIPRASVANFTAFLC